MISFYNTSGKVSMTSAYFTQLVCAVTQSGFGVAGMTSRKAKDGLRMLVKKGSSEQGVQVREENGELVIALRIVVTYGLNIAQAVKSITHKVKYVVEEATGLKVSKIDVTVDDVVI